MRILLLALGLLAFGTSFGQTAPNNEILRSGPMLGYAEMREAVVWVQLHGKARLWARYKATDASAYRYTDTLQTQEESAYTAKLYFKELDAGTTYQYDLIAGGKVLERPYPTTFTTASNWAYRRDPPAFSMALGSCTYINEKEYDRPGKPYGGGYSIFESIAAAQPDAMLWLGDNIYLRPGDWWTRSGYLARYSHTRALPEMQKLLATCNHYAIWDDHDFGPNNSSGSWIHRDWALESFKLFWPNPSYGYADLPGITTAFRYRGIDFFLMDNRYHRTEEHAQAPEHIWGRKQTDRLVDLLLQSNAPYKFVATGGQFLNSAQKYENHINFERERQYLIRRIEEEDIEGVVFLSGDRHHSEVMHYPMPGGNDLYEFTVSPLTSGPAQPEELNQWQIEGSLIEQRNYALLQVSGPYEARKVRIVFYSTEGKELYRYELPGRE